MNSALAALLRGNNTTISIAHRLSTIKRSDLLIVLSSEGKVAEQGTFQELSTKPDGAFTKLMEWQMSGGSVDDSTSQTRFGSPPDQRGPPSEAEEIHHRLADGRPETDHEVDNDSAATTSEDDVDEETVNVKKDTATAPEVVLEKAKQVP